MTPAINRQTGPLGPAAAAVTPERLDRAIAEGRRLQGLAMRRAFADARRFLGALPGRLAARLQSRETPDSWYRPVR